MDGLKRSDLILAVLCLATGAAVMLVAADVIDVADDSVNAPRWVLGLSGLVFVLGGFMIVTGAKSRFHALAAALLCGSFGLVGGWISFFSPDDSITGGSSFLSQSTNATIGRWMFGTGALICFAIAWIALRQFLRWDQTESEPAGA